MYLKIVGLFRKFMTLLVSLSILISFSSYTHAEIATGAKDTSPAKAHYNLAKKYFAELEFDEANAELEKALEADPHYVPALLMTTRLLLLKIGITKITKEDLELITIVAKKALKYSTTKEEKHEAYSILALALMSQGLFEECKVVLEKAVDFNPNDTTTQGLLAVTYIALSEKEKAVIAFKKTGDLSYEQEMYDTAIKSYKAALSYNPKSAEAHLGLGKSYYKQGKVRKSLREFKKTLQLNPDFAEAHEAIARVYYYDKKKVDKAIGELQKAIALEPKNPRYHFDLAVIYNDLKEYEKALVKIKRAIELESDRAKILIYRMFLGNCHWNLKEYDKAKTELKKIIDLNPPMEEPYILYGGVCLSKKEFKEAEVALKKALSINSQSFVSHLFLGQTYKEMNKIEQAKKEFKRVIELAPRRSDEAKGARKCIKELESKSKK